MLGKKGAKNRYKITQAEQRPQLHQTRAAKSRGRSGGATEGERKWGERESGEEGKEGGRSHQAYYCGWRRGWRNWRREAKVGRGGMYWADCVKKARFF